MNESNFKIEGKLWVSDDDTTIAKIEPVPPTIHFKGADNLEIMRLEPNGDIFVHGRLAENDKEVVAGLRKLLLSHGY